MDSPPVKKRVFKVVPSAPAPPPPPPPMKPRVFKIVAPPPPPSSPEPMKQRVFKVAKQIAPPPPPAPKTRILKVARRPAPPVTTLIVFTKHDRFSGEQLDDEGLSAGAARAALLPRRPAPPLPAIRQSFPAGTGITFREHLNYLREKLAAEK